MRKEQRLSQLKVIRHSATHGNRILLDPDAPQISWMTREDLHDWIWSMPETTVSAALDTNASWLCNMYAINRPSRSHWHRMRKGMSSPRDPLDPSLPPDMPVPLVQFEWSSAGSYAIVPHPAPWSRLGGPDRSGPIYPHDREHVPAVLAVGTSGRLSRRWTRDPVGPLPIPTVAAFRTLIWDTEPDDADQAFSLLGLTRREVAKIARREGLSVPSAAWWTSSQYGSRFPIPDATRPRKLSREDLKRPIDLSATTLAAVRKEIEADLVAEQQTRDRRRAASEAAAERRQSKLNSELSTVAEAIAGGASGSSICAERGVSREAFRAELRRRLRAALALERGGLGSADNITGRIMRGSADQWDLAIVDHLLRPEVHGIAALPSSAEGVSPYRWDITSIPGIARWKASAENTIEAMERLDDALTQCAAHIPDRLRLYRPAQA